MSRQLVDVSDIFIFFCSGRFGYFYFFLLGEGEGGVRGAGREGGGRLLLENPRRGVSRRGRGREGVCGELGNCGAGGG